ncbi:MAG: hypothetical protein ACXWNU_00855 [Candidatus Binataceae bacterium]
MKPTAVRAYCSPALVLLAFDWADGDRDDFLGFAIERTLTRQKRGAAVTGARGPRRS